MYAAIKIAHILGGAIIFGGGATVTLYLLLAHYLQHRQMIQVSVARALRFAWLIMTPTMIWQLLTGFSMISLKPYAYRSPWVMGIFIAFAMAGLCWFPCLYYLSQCHDILQSAKQAPLPAHYHKSLHKQLVFGSLALCCLLAMLFLMTNISVMA